MWQQYKTLWRNSAILLVSVFFLQAITVHADTENLWVLSYEGKSTNDWVWDKRTKGLLRKSLPPRMRSSAFLDGLWGAPDAVIISDRRYFSASACAQHACYIKSFFWMDVETGRALAAVFNPDGEMSLEIGSNAFEFSTLPTDAYDAIIAWLGWHDLQPSSVLYSGLNTRTKVNPRLVQPQPRYVPNPNGPSFDCAISRSVIEDCICHNPLIAQLDLELFSVVDGLSHAFSTMPARDQLSELNAEWVLQRDRECVTPPEIDQCLVSAYRDQLVKLKNWTPSSVKRVSVIRNCMNSNDKCF